MTMHSFGKYWCAGWILHTEKVYGGIVLTVFFYQNTFEQYLIQTLYCVMELRLRAFDLFACF